MISGGNKTVTEESKKAHVWVKLSRGMVIRMREKNSSLKPKSYILSNYIYL